MIIREVTTTDAEAFLQLSKQIDQSGSMLYEPGEKTTTVDEQRKMIARISSQFNSTLLVAEQDRTLAGFIMAAGGATRRNQHSAYLVLGVDEKFHGQGIASQLMDELLQWAKQIGLTRLELTVIKHNTRAFSLYQKKGFVLEGEKVHSLMIDGEPVNEYYLYKLLTPEE
ncbi:N-acetyltransferase family protein [Alkalihalobacillus sp. 1P02AB]|uniref:GNAT family N-acetyltransferase n=1 Tax=Alkalihalobacillus sp. 1P02AB TaxID=3132260 RepID=UPI0039A4B571